MKIKAILLAMLMFLMPCMAYGANGDAFCVGCDMRPVKAGKLAYCARLAVDGKTASLLDIGGIIL